jgi:hypothetical protein
MASCNATVSILKRLSTAVHLQLASNRPRSLRLEFPAKSRKGKSTSVLDGCCCRVQSTRFEDNQSFDIPFQGVV